MTSITRTLTLSLGVAATAIFLVLLSIVIWLEMTRERELTFCQAAAAILDHATVVDTDRGLITRSSEGLEELKSASPDLWYLVSYDNLINEFERELRPALPFPLPYTGPIGFSVLNTLDQKGTFCLAVVRRRTSELVMMIGVRKSGSTRSRNRSSSATFFKSSCWPLHSPRLSRPAHSCPRALWPAASNASRKLALAIEPTKPQASIPLDAVPLELKPLASALNRAFHEIDAYMRAQRRFLGNAAHQLRTPLTLLRAKIEDASEPALRAELVRDVRRLTSLVSAMLDLARLQNHAIEKRPIDLAALTRDILADFSPSALDAGIELTLEQASPGPVMVHGVEAAVRSALANLVGNALIHARGAKYIVATLDSASVSIRDNGSGISASIARDCVEPFQTGDAATQGAGLGLSIVQEIMAAHGGTLTITSIPGQGTTACLCFPEVSQAPGIAKSRNVGAM